MWSVPEHAAVEQVEACIMQLKILYKHSEAVLYSLSMYEAKPLLWLGLDFKKRCLMYIIIIHYMCVGQMEKKK
jgi:hypothetical protein